MTPQARDHSATACGVRAHFERRGHGAEFEMESAWVRAHVAKRNRLVLDVGCGNGALFDAIGAHRVIGVDANLSGLTTCSRVGPARTCCANGLALPFAEGTFDAVTAQHVIEHLGDQLAALREWRRVLAPGGRLLVLTPNAEFADPSAFADPTHTRLLNAGELEVLAELAGLRVVDLRTLGLPWFRRSARTLWRARRFVTRRARGLARLPWLRRRGQTLCLAAERLDQDDGSPRRAGVLVPEPNGASAAGPIGPSDLESGS